MNHAARKGPAVAQWATMGGIALIALLLRLAYVNLAIVDHPLRGDAVQYFSYAFNMARHHVFSIAPPDAAILTPDSFRDPGYPAFLALILSATGTGETFYRVLLDTQCLLSTFTVMGFMILARRWLGYAAALAVGILMAIWPHLITLGGYVLSETLMGALVAAALLLTDTAIRRGAQGWYVAAGVSFGLAALTNVVILPFAPLLALFFFYRNKPRRLLWTLFVIGFAVPTGAWGLRGASLPAGQSSTDRAMMNLVQGAWPEYHAAYRGQLAGNPEAIAIMQAIDAEYTGMTRDRMAGLSAMTGRLAQDPLRTLAWYASKPTHLWGWDIGIGQGDIYVFPTLNSPLLFNPLWRGLTGLLFLLNPMVMLAAAVGTLLALVSPAAPTGLKITALLGLFITAIFTILQSDARYATPYRGVEMLMTVYAIARLVTWVRRRDGQKLAHKTDL